VRGLTSTESLLVASQELFDELPVAVLVTNAAGTLLAINRTAAEMLGFAAPDILGRPMAGLTVPQSAPGTARRRLRLVHKDGHEIVTEGRARPLPDGRIVHVLEDVTAAVAREKALRDNADQLAFVADAVPALMAYVDADARYVWVNASYQRWFGTPPEAVRGRHASEVLGSAAWETIRPYFERVFAGEEVTFEQRLTYKTGPSRDVRATYVPHVDAGGRVRGLVALVNDITEIRAAEAALRRSEHMLEQSEAIAHVGSWEATLGDDSRPKPGALRWSNEVFRIFGLEPGSVEPTQALFHQIIHPDDREGMRAAGDAARPRGESFEREYRIVRPDGAVRLLHSWTGFERDGEGRPRRMLGTCQDITERRRAEHELREADRRKDEFLAMLAHELRNPLGPILNAAEVLACTGPELPEITAKFRTVIARQVQHMKRLLDDLLDVSRVSQGKIQLRAEAVELGAVLAQAVEVSQPILGEKRQQLTVRGSAVPLPLDADPTRLLQVFANIINNAAKYTDAGGHISITASVDAGEAVVAVRDDGVGMAPELLDTAFDLFVQETRSLDRAQGGLGIGLTMVRTLVKLHGGSVRALSEGPGRGSEIVVRLPLAHRAAQPESRAGAEGPPAPAGALRVLVVDDNTDAARALGRLLELLGHQVAVAHDGPGALEAASTLHPELVLLDLGLPGMDGYAVAARLRAAGHRPAALVALTGYGQAEHHQRSTDAGFDHHLVKPVDFARLRQIAADVRRARADAAGEPPAPGRG
jgi:two-component system CheB/CheR fusion protein